MNDTPTPPPPTSPPPAPETPAPPPAAPPPSMPSAPQPSVNAADAVTGPATGLLVTAIVGALLNLLGLLFNALGTGMGALGSMGDQDALYSMLSGGVGIVSSLIGLAIAGLLVYVTMEMKKLKNWNLAMAGSILAMIPCISPCCLMGLPIGIWAIVVLTKPEIKSAFS